MSNTKRGFLRNQSRRGQEGSTEIYLSLFVLALVVILGFFYLTYQTSEGDKSIKAGLSNSYGARLVSVSKPLFDKNTMVIERDGKQYRCDYPSAKMVESKAPLSCGEALTSISPK